MFRIRQSSTPLSPLLTRLRNVPKPETHTRPFHQMVMCGTDSSHIIINTLFNYIVTIDTHYSLDYPLLSGFLATTAGLDAARRLLMAQVAHHESRGRAVTSYLYNKVLNILVRQDRIHEALTYFTERMAPHRAFDTCTFNILIKGLCRAGRVRDGYRVFEDMRTQFGVVPDVITYNTMIDGLCRVNEVYEARDLLMEACRDLTPDVVTYTCIISGFCRLGKMEEAYSLFNEMVMSAGIKPSVVTFNVLIDGFGKVGDTASALEVYERMLLVGCCPDVVTFTSRIEGYCRAGEVDVAMRIWEEMIRKGLFPNEYTFSVVVIALCKANRICEACEVLERLKSMDGVTPRAFIYNPVIDVLCKGGNVDKANLVVSDMKSRCKPDKYTFTILIIGHCMKGRMFEAINIFNEMLAVGCVPDDITIKSLISCLVKAGMPNEASQIKKDLALWKDELSLSSSRTSISGQGKYGYSRDVCPNVGPMALHHVSVG